MAVPRTLRAPGYDITRDPRFVKNRIYLGNLPSCTTEELESICLPYGKVLGSMVQNHFGFVQFETEELADVAAAALNKSTFKSNILTVRNASTRNPNAKKTVNAQVGGSKMAMPTLAMPADVIDATVLSINDCEIIVVNKENTKYAEYVEERLTQAGMRVDVLFPNEDKTLPEVLTNITLRGALYAVVVTPQHEQLNSITVNILYGVPEQHRNMPLDDAIKLIITDFRLHKQRNSVPVKMAHCQPGHPEHMQKLLHLLAENRSLTAIQYECVIKYLQEEHEKQLMLEVGVAKLQAPDPEIELQKKILSIMNKPSVTEINYELMYSTIEEAKQDKGLMKLLQDSRVMAALESVYESELLDTLAEYL